MPDRRKDIERNRYLRRSLVLEQADRDGITMVADGGGATNNLHLHFHINVSAQDEEKATRMLDRILKALSIGGDPNA